MEGVWCNDGVCTGACKRYRLVYATAVPPLRLAPIIEIPATEVWSGAMGAFDRFELGPSSRDKQEYLNVPILTGSAERPLNFLESQHLDRQPKSCSPQPDDPLW